MPPYLRNIFEKEFKKAKARLAKATGNYHRDTYTGKPLIPGGSWDFDHIISAKAFSAFPNVHLLSHDIQSKILSSLENIAITERTINKSKGKHELPEWLKRKSNGRTVTNEIHYNITESIALKAYYKALEFLKGEIQKQVK